MSQPMPKIDLSNLTPAEMKLAKGIVNSRTGCLRASKPKVTYRQETERRYEPKYVSGCTAYIWRTVAFAVSPISQHQCMPVMAFCDIPGENSEKRRELGKELDKISDKIIDAVPVTQWHGIARWGKAFGRW